MATARPLRLPPRIKVLEALGAIADGRVEKTGDHVYRVVSSEGDRVYRVYVDPGQGLAYSDDNGTKLRGYVGYPIIAVLMLEGVLPYDERLAKALQGIPWRRLNEKYKRYALVEAEVKRVAAGKGVAPAELDAFVEKVMAELHRLKLRLTTTLPLDLHK
ncbi:hypothetical protein [Hyperthermus butylicus]|uniref:Universally conserved protein n=1 Tax=Hyperthermus butylicus (strain DSM 5456 / JCM 9403 / PLM1-5) TaxID=415426 RepID=A2BLI3_HYPBU|nr:hypothetical protein [Hyperthermus butylicus]ABM80844.1 universally conserved protein [Hyperthermus butylicus DSM 5456]